MGMAANELFGDRLHDAAEIELARLLGHPGVEDDLQQEIAELIAQVREVAALDRVPDFVGFFDRKGGDRREGLLDVPGAAATWIAQRRHDGQEFANVAGRLHEDPQSQFAA